MMLNTIRQDLECKYGTALEAVKILFTDFIFFVDDNGFQSQETSYLDKTTKVRLIDLSSKLDDTKLQRKWTDAETVAHSVVCDRLHPDNSIVHIIAKRGGLNAREINCGTLLFDVPYVVCMERTLCSG